MSRRFASHADKWYSSDRIFLTQQLDGWLKECKSSTSIKAIIVPHAGYIYSGPVASSGYSEIKSIKCKKIVLLGPSHYKLLNNQCALSSFSSAETPLGDLKFDVDTINSMKTNSPNLFTFLSPEDELKEHSLEMHFPLIHKLFGESNINVIPIQVGHFSDSSKLKETANCIAELVPNISSNEVLFIVSSDFCHYGHRFDFNPKFSNTFSISENISRMDKKALTALNCNDPIESFKMYLRDTQNTVCGREAIILLLEILKKCSIAGKWHLIDYAQSNSIISLNDSSVSYLAASFKVDEPEQPRD